MECLTQAQAAEGQGAASAACRTTLLTCAGLFMGTAVKLLDLYTLYLGDLFSRTSVWVFLCTLIASASQTQKRAAISVLAFCAGMLTTYYGTAALIKNGYSSVFFGGWAAFSLFAAALGAFIRYAQTAGRVLSFAVALGVPVVMLAAAQVLFDKIRLSDLAFAVVTALYLCRRNKEMRKGAPK